MTKRHLDRLLPQLEVGQQTAKEPPDTQPRRPHGYEEQVRQVLRRARLEGQAPQQGAQGRRAKAPRGDICGDA